jgi:transcriptional regulator with PAS, ATPase and Fis domain
LQLGAKLWFVERYPLLDDGRFFITLHLVDDIETIERRVRQRRAGTGHVARYTFDDLVGQSPAMRFVISRATQFAQADSSVLIVGETGTGKEMLAQSIHNASTRAQGPFVGVNCAALPEQLLESELFGYEEGAFTGAKRGGKPGLFELAHGGTLFLDEIGETSLHVQQRLLRVLQERQVMRIGGERLISVDVRVVAATNQPLWRFVQEGKFRKDLFFRLDVLRLNTIPLRERREDIPDLTEHMLYQLWYQRKGVGVRPRLDPAIFPLLQAYDWPGNVRELQSMLDYLLATQVQGKIGVEAIEEWVEQKALPPVAGTVDSATSSEGAFRSKLEPYDAPDAKQSVALAQLPGRTMEEIERWAIERTLAETSGDMTRAAQMLGISRTTLWRKMKQWQTETMA